MPCYVIVEMERIDDPQALAEYIAGAPATVAAHGGRYVLRGVAAETLEGRDAGARMSMIEFPDAAAARAWYASAEYSSLAAVRQRSAPSRFLILEGEQPA